jgi:transposase
MHKAAYTCEYGNFMDRAENAAINIRSEGLRILAQ